MNRQGKKPENRMEKQQKPRRRRIRIFLPVLAAAMIFAGCGMFDGGEAEVKVDFGQYGNENGGENDRQENAGQNGGQGNGSGNGEPGNAGENDSQGNGGGNDAQGSGGQDGNGGGENGDSGDSQEPDASTAANSEEWEQQMEEFRKSEFAEELLAYLKENGRGDEAFSEPIFDSANKVYSREELNQLSDIMCKIFRNEIYARHGMIFGDEDLNQLYGAFSWYEGTIGLREFEAQAELPFNDTENKNISNVVAVEKARRGN